MSYRSFKNVLGETHLERKCFFAFGTVLLFCIVGSFWLYAQTTDGLVLEGTHRTARGLADTILYRRHWDALETQHRSEFVEFAKELSSSLASQKYKSRFVRPLADVSDQQLDDTEADMLDYFDRNPPPEKDWDAKSENGEYRYFQAIRTKDSCINCHRSIPMYRRADVRAGDLEAVIEVSLPDAETQAAQTENRAWLLALAIITVFVAMLLSWFIVRYVIVKPLKHLRDVSDEISRGNIALRAEIHTGDEFEDLGAAFNRMLRHLTTIQEELRNANSNLDLKVDELAQLNMQLYEMNRLKSEFLAMMSHELRTPLNAIIGFSDVLHSIASLDEKQKRYVKNIQTSGKVLLEMINDILDLAKIESGNMEVRLSEFRIEGVVHGLCDTYMQATERKNIDLNAEIEPNLPEMFQDQVKVQQIISNLLSNAIKFTPEGGRITIAAGRNERDDLLLKVIDTGVGIASEDQTLIFEKFRQGKAVFSGGDAMTREYSGTGLGLSIVKELCKLLGGEVLLESELGKGSTFTVRLPWTRIEQPKLDSSLSASLEGLAKARRVDYPRSVDQPVGASG
jgi:two-component system, NarL family, sensor histidine kinase BarA